MQKQTKPILHQHCQFPTAVRRDMKESQYKTINIFEREDTITAWQQDRQTLREVVLNAWAVLLRYYVGNDIVAFLALTDPQGHYDVGSTESESCFGEDTEAVVLQYHFFDNLLLHDIRAIESTKCTGYEMGDVRVNSVVRFLSLCAPGSLQGNQTHLLPTRAEDAVALNNVRLVFIE